jgi:hypothetical protein
MPTGLPFTSKKSKPTSETSMQTSYWFLKHTSPPKAILKFPITQYTTPNTPMVLPTGGTAIITKTGIKHHLHEHCNVDHLQATSVVIEDWIGPLTLAAVYCPPKHNIKAEQFRSFFSTLGQRFLAGGDYNAKHPRWGSRPTTLRGRELYKAM